MADAVENSVNAKESESVLEKEDTVPGKEAISGTEKQKVLQKKKFLIDTLAFLKEVQAKYKEGDSETASKMLNDRMQMLKSMLPDQSNINRPSKSPLELQKLKAVSLLASDDVLELVPINDEKEAQNYLRVHKENDILGDTWDDGYETAMKKEILSETSFYSSIYLIDTGECIGYCGINNTAAEEWELAIELLRKYHHMGYGYRAMRCFMDSICAETGVEHFKVRVDPDNVASQSLMKKLGFKPAGITTYLIKDEKELLQFEEENMKLLNDRLVQLAEEFQVEPRKLLSHVLVYKI